MTARPKGGSLDWLLQVVSHKGGHIKIRRKLSPITHSREVDKDRKKGPCALQLILPFMCMARYTPTYILTRPGQPNIFITHIF